MASSIVFLITTNVLWAHRIIGFGPFLIHDVPSTPLHMQNGIRFGSDKIDRVVINLVDLSIAGDAGLQIRTLSPDTCG